MASSFEIADSKQFNTPLSSSFTATVTKGEGPPSTAKAWDGLFLSAAEKCKCNMVDWMRTHHSRES